MASLNDLREAKGETEKSAWMVVRFWEGTSRAGQPIESGDGKPWRILIRNAFCQSFQAALKSFNWQRQLKLKLDAMAGEDTSQTAVSVTEEFLEFEKEKFRECLILDWENLTDGPDPVTCSPANVRKILFDDYPEIFEQIKAFSYEGAAKAQLIQSPADLVADIEKKALNGSDGEPESSLASGTMTVDSETLMPTSSSSPVEASLPALA